MSPEENELTQAAPTTDERPPDNPKFFRWLCYVEFGLVCLITLSGVLVTLYLAVWVAFDWLPDVHFRLVETLHGINKGWKIALVILIPLFFRPLAKFLIHLKKAHGWESGDPVKGGASPVQEYRNQ